MRLACLDRIQRSSARLIGQIPKFGHVTGYMLEVLRWLPVRQRIEYRVASLVWRCQLGIAPIYLIIFVDLCRILRVVAPYALLEGGSSQSRLLVLLSCKSALFCVNGPSVWNGLPLELSHLARTPSDTFYRLLITVPC